MSFDGLPWGLEFSDSEVESEPGSAVSEDVVSEASGPNPPEEFLGSDSEHRRPNSVQDYKWFTTWNNYPPDAEAQLLSKFGECEVLVAGREIAPTTGTPHLQMVVSWGTKGVKKSRKQMCALLSLHWETCRNLDKAIAYCRKDGEMLVDRDDRVRTRSKSAKPKRRAMGSDVSDSAWAAAAAGNPSPALAEMSAKEQVFMAKRIKDAVLTLPLLTGTACTRAPPLFTWIYGPPGTGKTNYVSSFITKWAANSSYFVSPPREGAKGIWMDGYFPARHKVVVLDDARPLWLGPSELLTLCNSTGRTVEWKGASTPFNSEVIFLTSTEPPWGFYSQYPSEAAQVARRVNLLIKFSYLQTEVEGPPSGIVSSFSLPGSFPFQGTAVPSVPTGLGATSAVPVDWGRLSVTDPEAAWCAAISAPRGAPQVKGKVMAKCASGESQWFERALSVARDLGFEGA